MRNSHQLKTWSKFFQQVWDGDKTFEIRKNDRDFEAGDLVILHEWLPLKDEFTDRHIKACIGSITDFKQKSEYVVFSLLEATNYE